MNCPYCATDDTRKRAKKTKLGYATFFCPHCHHVFNERTGTSFNHLEFPTDIVLLAVLWRLRYKLSLRDVAEMFLVRGFSFTHEAIRDWEARFAPLITDQLRLKQQGQAGKSWYVDETYVKVHGKWCYLYRAIDHDGHLVDSMLSEKRNMEAAQTFFKQAVAVVGSVPDQVTADGHRSYPRAIREIRRIAQLSPSPPNYGRTGLTSRTATSVPPASCSPTDSDASTLIGHESYVSNSIRKLFRVPSSDRTLESVLDKSIERLTLVSARYRR